MGLKAESVKREGEYWTIRTDKGEESISLWGAPGRKHAQLSFDPEMICRLREEEGRFEVRANLWNVVHRDAVRLMVRRYGGGVIIDSGPADEKGVRARDALLELGVPADKDDFNPDRFMPKEYA